MNSSEAPGATTIFLTSRCMSLMPTARPGGQILFPELICSLDRVEKFIVVEPEAVFLFP